MALDANPWITLDCSSWKDSAEPCNHDTGLPYVIHDGFRNLDGAMDSNSIVVMVDTLELLTLAWWFTGEAKYSSEAMRVFDAWFINGTSRMNPHLEYAQLMPGREHEHNVPSLFHVSYHLNAKLNDCVAILETQGAKVWTPEIAAAWREWANDWLAWWSSSQAGVINSQSRGSHGTFYHTHLLAMAYSLDQEQLCVDTVNKLWQDLPCSLDKQITATGEMREAAKGAAGVTDSLQNLDGLLGLAIMARRICFVYHCRGSFLTWNRETEVPRGLGLWSTLAGVHAKCREHLGSARMPTVEECRTQCLDGRFPNCNAIHSRPHDSWVECRFHNCRGEAVETVSDSRWTMHTLTARMEPGRGSVRKAFEYMATFAERRDQWQRVHPATLISDAAPDKFRPLGKLARMISSSSLAADDVAFEAKVSIYDDQFASSWENLVFPPPTFIHGKREASAAS